MNIPLLRQETSKPLWRLRDKSLLLVMGGIGAGIGYLVLRGFAWSGIDIPQALIILSLAAEILRLRVERRKNQKIIDELRSKTINATSDEN